MQDIEACINAGLHQAYPRRQSMNSGMQRKCPRIAKSSRTGLGEKGGKGEEGREGGQKVRKVGSTNED